MDKDLIAYLDQRFRETSMQIESLREQNAQRFEQIDSRFERAEEAIRHTQITVEGLRSDIRQMAEGVIFANESLMAFRTVVSQQLDELKKPVTQAYTDLSTRLRKLESWRETKERDPIEIIREKWGKPQT